jgi:hypothetical protein
MIRSRLFYLIIGILAWNCSLKAQSGFEDDFNRPDGAIGNGWTLWGNQSTTLLGGEVRTLGAPGVAGGIARPFQVTFPMRFSFDFRSLNNGIDPYNDSGWFIAFNAFTPSYATHAELKFYQYAGSRNVFRETSAGTMEFQPNISGPIPGWQDFTAAPAYVAGTVNADLSASITVTYSNGFHVSVSFPPTQTSSQGKLLLLGNSNGSNGPHIFDNLNIGPPELVRVATLPQVASGGGWKTAITLVNPSAATTTARVDFFANDGSPLVLPIVLPQMGLNATSSSANVTIGPNASVVIHSEASTPALLVGWADIKATAPLRGYSIFRYRAPDLAESEGTVSIETEPSSTLVLPYDNTNGYRTGIALTNVTASSASAEVIVTDQDGVPITSSLIDLAPFEHVAFFVTERFYESADQFGMIHFHNLFGALTAVGLRFSPTGTFTSVPTIR